MSERSPRFAAIIGHADAPELLDACIRHHLGIGAQQVFVSLNRGAGELPADLAGDERVRAAPVEAFAGDDPFLYFSAALRELRRWGAPDWVLFADSDEFWLPRGGRLDAVADLDAADLFVVERYNTPVLRAQDGLYLPPDLTAPHTLPIVAQREAIEDRYLAGDTRTPWILGADAPKLLVRAEAVARVGTGGHSIVAEDPSLRWRLAHDVLILHAPFTTEARFTDKVAAIRAAFAAHRDRFDARQAWHWRHWLGLSDEELATEFRRQSFRASAVEGLRRQGVLGRVEDQYAALARNDAQPTGDALQELLGRVITNYRRPAAGRAGAGRMGAAPGAAPGAASGGGTASADAPLEPAPHRHVEHASDCYFYHCMTIPGHGDVGGQWDLRGGESAYLGGIDLRGKTVLEIGPASGYLTFWMERQGATVTSFDLNENQEWDIVPFAGLDRQAAIDSRKAVMRQINNSWWFTRNRLGAQANVVYGNVYQLDRLAQTFDVVTINSVLLHLRDPFLALTRAAARSHAQIVVTDIAESHFLGPNPPPTDRLSMHFMPRAENHGPLDSWWYVPEGLAREFLRILGFRSVVGSQHTQRFMPDHMWPFYTLLGTR